MPTPNTSEVRESIFPDEKEQDEILKSYVKIFGEQNAGKLHQFFSPTKIPKGLTLEQARICINLQPLRNTYHNLSDGWPEPLHESLVYRGENNISDEDFLKGIDAFLTEIKPVIETLTRAYE